MFEVDSGLAFGATAFALCCEAAVGLAADGTLDETIGLRIVVTAGWASSSSSSSLAILLLSAVSSPDLARVFALTALARLAAVGWSKREGALGFVTAGPVALLAATPAPLLPD